MKVFNVNARIPNPRVPTSRTDPIGGARFINRANRIIDARYKIIAQNVKELFLSIPAQANNAEGAQFTYDFSSQRALQLSDQLQRILDQMLLEGFEYNELWSGELVKEAYQSGTALANANLSNMSATYATSRPLAAVLYSEPYLRRVGLAYTKAYSDWKGLSDKARADLASTMSELIAMGANPKAAVPEIMKRVNVSRSYAKALAQTEITDTLRQARWAESDEAKSSLGLDVKILWSSALKPTTRATHAARHGGVFTQENCREFYSKNGNRFRCFCSSTEVLMLGGEPQVTEKLVESYSKEKKTWEREYA
ncbi:head assembly protein [Yersinia phage vB_YenS_P400]|nr:head assembly protein [Yersinia phage vB_YenS_P400]